MGCSGAAALYFGKQTFLGISAAMTNGLSCTDVNLVTIRKQDHVWIRKYIRTEPTDGLTRAKTALRVAKAVYEEQKPDLVQVVVLDQNGPILRSDLRGRAFGADVVYTPHPEAVGEPAGSQQLTARYYDGTASDAGLFYGERIEMPPKDIDTIMAGLKDVSDCANPVAAAEPPKGEAKKKSEHVSLTAPAVTNEYTASIPQASPLDTLFASPTAEDQVQRMPSALEHAR